MPSVCGYTWPDWLDNLIISRSRLLGVPLDISYAFIAAESGFYTRAVGDAGCSSGLLQLNTCGGQGTGYTVEQLWDPVLNLDIGLPPLAIAFRMCWSADIPQETFIRCVMRNSGHPGNVPDGNIVFEQAFNAIWPRWQCFYNELIMSTSGNPIITGDPNAGMNPPYPAPVIAPFQPGQPVVIENQPIDSGESVVPLLFAGAVGLLLLNSTGRKKIIIKNPLKSHVTIKSKSPVTIKKTK